MTDELKRRIGLPLLAAYGVGVIVGAGIYVLIGAVAAQAGLWAPLAFVMAGVIAAPTALSYAEFSARIPQAAGEAAYVRAGLGSRALSLLVGLAIVIGGTVSAAAVLQGGAGYLTAILPVSQHAAIIGLGVILTLVAGVGVLESLSMAALFTVIELTGLGLVIWAGFSAPPVAVLADMPAPDWNLIAAGALLAFFAFIGFEDIVNMAEEVRDPTRTLPRAILIALAVTSVLYALVAWAAVRSVPVADLAGSDKPLALIWTAATGQEARFLSGIAVFAALNGVLAQIVMAARVLYGLGQDTYGLTVFHHAHPRFGTPVLATVLLGVAVIAASLLLPLVSLAEATSTVVLLVFLLVNLALIGQKRHQPQAPFRVPMAVPVLGATLAFAALVATFGGVE